MEVITPQTWESKQVAAWISSIGFKSLEKKIIDHGISGELLVHADHDFLKELNIKSVGARVKILNCIYGLKLKYNVPIEDYDYIPKSIRLEMEKDIILNETKYKIIDNKYKESEQYITKLGNEVKRINEDMKQFKEDIKTIKLLMNNNVNKPEIYKVKSNSNLNLLSLAEPENVKNWETIKVYSALEKQECETLYKSLRLNIDDTTEGFLDEVLKKYQIKNNIALYRLSINSDRYLENDEHPLEVLQNFRAKGIEAQLFLRKINLKDEQKAKLNSFDMKAVSMNSVKEGTDKAYVLMAYKKKKDNEVSVEVGEIIEILDRESVEKYRVQKKGGIIGYLPTECFVEKEAGDEMVIYDTPLESEIKKDYKKMNAYEISLKKGDKIKIHAQFRTWNYVESNKKQGWVPITHIGYRRPRSLTSPLSQSKSLEDISKLDIRNGEGTDQHFLTGFGSSSLLNKSNSNFASVDEKLNLMLEAPETEKIIPREFKKLPPVPISSSFENLQLHQPTSPKRDKLTPNITQIKTSTHMRSSSSNDSLPSANSMLYSKFHLPTHSRQNSDNYFHNLEKLDKLEKENNKSAGSNNNSSPYSRIPKAFTNTEEDDRINKNAFSKLTDLLSNFSYESDGEGRKLPPTPPKKNSNSNSNTKPFQNY